MRRITIGWLRNRKLRRGGIIMSLVAVTALATLIGVEVDSGRLYVAAQRDQIVADAMTMAAAQSIFDSEVATAKAMTIKNLYQTALGATLNHQITFYPANAARPTSVRIQITEQFPAFFQGLSSNQYSTIASAVATRTIPSALVQGAAPLGVQYDQDFTLPANGNASEEIITLRAGNSDKQKGNTYALDLPAGSGSTDWSQWLNYGYDGRLAVGDTIKSKPGKMTGPIEDALVGDANSRLNRALNAPYEKDTYDNFRPGNPRIAMMPLVDWQGATGGSATLTIKGFAAFWIEAYDSGSGAITGRFVRAVSLGNWPGVSIDPTRSDAFDSGFWAANLAQ